MLNEIGYAFPAGDESDGSNDEWDIGYSDNNKKTCAEVNLTKRFLNSSNTRLVPCYILAIIRPLSYS